MKLTTLFCSVLFSILFGAIPSLLQAQNIISGHINDSNTHLPVAGAQISLPDINLSVFADSIGQYNFKSVPNGTYLLKVSALKYATELQRITIKNNIEENFLLRRSATELKEVIITGVTIATDRQQTPVTIATVNHDYLVQNAATNVIDAIARTPGVSAITDGQSIAKPVIRGLGYNRVLTISDGVQQAGQAWFDEFGIEADPDAVARYEILKGPASLSYGSDAIAGVVNLIPEESPAEGKIKGIIQSNYQTNNGLLNNMIYLAGTKNGFYWGARVDDTRAHAYRNKFDGYVLNSQFSNFNTDGTLGLHGKWGYTQLHASYFNLQTGIVDGTRDSTTGALERPVAYPGLNGGAPTYVLPTHQEQINTTPFVINQRIRHTKLVWDNSITAGNGRVKALFSYQQNRRQENNDPIIPDVSNIYYSSNAATYDVRYISAQLGGFNFSGGANGIYQSSKSLGTLLLIPDYHFFSIGAFAIVNKKIGNLNLSGGLRYDTRTFTGADHWVDSTSQAPAAPNAPNAIHEFQGFTSRFSGMSFSLGGSYAVGGNGFIKANIARGWRAPNVAEAAANGVHDGTVVYEIGDHTLRPETSLEEDIAIGVNSKNIDFEIDAFNNNINSFIYAQGLHSTLGGDSINNSLHGAGLGDAPVYKYTQGKARLYGGEAVLNIHPKATPWVQLNSTLSMVYGGLSHTADSTKYLPFVPPTRITADLKFPVATIGKGIRNAYFKIGMLSAFQQSNIYRQYAIYNGLNTPLTPYEYAASTSATKGYTLFNAGVGGDIISSGKTVCQLYFICNNLFNTGYIDYLSRFKYFPVNYTSGRVGVFNMGRNLSVKLIIPLDFSPRS